jgi:hypothetical protein
MDGQSFNLVEGETVVDEEVHLESSVAPPDLDVDGRLVQTAATEFLDGGVPGRDRVQGERSGVHRLDRLDGLGSGCHGRRPSRQGVVGSIEQYQGDAAAHGTEVAGAEAVGHRRGTDAHGDVDRMGIEGAILPPESGTGNTVGRPGVPAATDDVAPGLECEGHGGGGRCGPVGDQDLHASPSAVAGVPDPAPTSVSHRGEER